MFALAMTTKRRGRERKVLSDGRPPNLPLESVSFGSILKFKIRKYSLSMCQTFTLVKKIVSLNFVLF